MRAVNGKDLKLVAGDAADPAGGVDGLAVGGHDKGIFESGKTGLALGKFADLADGNPREISVVAAACDGRQNITQNGNGQANGDQAIEENSELHEKAAARESVVFTH